MLAATPARRREMGERGRAHIVHQFSVERVHHEVVTLYDRLLREKGLA